MVTQTHEAQRLKNCRAAAEYLGISERKMWGLGKTEAIKPIRFGGCVRFDLEDLDEWIEKQKA